MKIKKITNEQFWTTASLVLAGIILAILLAQITPVFNYIIWGIEH